MKTVRFFLILLLFTNATSAQLSHSACQDSSFHIRYSSQYPTLLDSFSIDRRIQSIDGGTIALGNIETIKGKGSPIIISFKKDASIGWSKRLITNPVFPIQGVESVVQASNGNIAIGCSASGTNTPFVIVVLSSSGNIISHQSIGFSDIPNLAQRWVRAPLVLTKGTDSLVFTFFAQVDGSDNNTAKGDRICLVFTDNSGNIGRTTILSMDHFSSDEAYFNYGRIIQNRLQLFGCSFFKNQCSTPTFTSYPAFAMIEIDLKSLNVKRKKAFCSPIEGSYFNPYIKTWDYYTSSYYNNVFFQSNGNIIFTRTYAGLIASGTDTSNQLFSVSEFDSSFNALHSEYIVTGNFLRTRTSQEICIDSNGRKYLFFNNFDTHNLYYAVSDSDNNFLLQKKMMLPNYSAYQFFTRNSLVNSGFFANFFILSNNTDRTYVDLIDVLPNDIDKTCFGVDTTFLFARQASVSPINWSNSNIVTEQGTLITAPINIFSVDFPLIREEICTVRHICDTLKLHAPDTVCNISQPVIISTFKNPYCDSKINYRFDTTSVSSYNQINDTTLQLSFDRSYKGWVYATASSCPALIDSTQLLVLGGSQNIDLGKDTILCPNNSLVLHAGANFKSYQWQNGSTDSVYLVSQPGKFYVTTIDYCRNVYSDTINVIKANYLLSLGDDVSICKTQNVTLAASSGFSNYIWSPNYNISSITGQSVSVSPEITTAYTVTAQKFPGCDLKDTIVVKVKNCPQYFYVPTAFSPNHDGKNDFFKPIISGILESYEFTVYNRWGQIVFTTKHKSEGWDGSLHGQLQDSNVFIWVCKYKFNDQQQEIKRGTILLVH